MSVAAREAFLDVKDTKDPGKAWDTKVLAPFRRSMSHMATRTKGLNGTWKPEFRTVFVGDIYQVMPLAARALKVDVDASGAAMPRMTLASRDYTFENGGPNATMIMTGRFKMGEGYPPQAQWFWSSFEFHPAEGLILEWAHGQNMTQTKLWEALFLWRRP